MRKSISNSDKITILFLSWRDIKAPKHGGAEIYTHEMLKRIDLNKYRIIHFSPEFEEGASEEFVDGIEYIRSGNAFSVIWKARQFYRRNKEHINFVVDQCNTHRFFSKLWVPHRKRIFFIHQLTREIWYKNMKFPMNYIGAKTETPFLKLNKNDYTMTVSGSTEKDLIDVGFEKNNIRILPEGINFEHWTLDKFKEKEKEITFIYVGRFSNYKGIDDVVEAYGRLKAALPNSKLWIVGKKKEEYVQQVLSKIFDRHNLTFGDEGEGKDITFFGFVSEEKKLELMSRAHCLICPSKREGWGLIVTEAAAVGTPSIVYNSPGLRDAVNFGKAGVIVESNTVEGLMKYMTELMDNQFLYDKTRFAAYRFSLKFHWDHTAESFNNFITEIIQRRASYERK